MPRPCSDWALPRLVPQVVELDAGHCPHDEVPELVNSHLVRFIKDTVVPSMAQSSGGAAAGSDSSGVAAAGSAAAAR